MCRLLLQEIASFLRTLSERNQRIKFSYPSDRIMHNFLENPDPNSSNSKKHKSVPTFLKNTYAMINGEQNSNYIKWAPTGIGFIVIDEESLSKIVLPKYFKHHHYSSFVRQLNMYNFHKIHAHNSQQSYFMHESFAKDNKSAMQEIKRKHESNKKKHNLIEHAEHQSHQKTLIKHRKEKEYENHHHDTIIESLCDRVSIDLLKLRNNQELIELDNHPTQHVFSQTLYAPEPWVPKIENQEMKQDEQRVQFSQKLDSIDDDDDYLSINNNDIIIDNTSRIATRELLCQSSNNLLPTITMKQGQQSATSLFQ